jgi:hypothetical protein
VSFQLQSAAIYVLGFVGLVAVGLLPYRAVQLLRELFTVDGREMPAKLLGVFAVLVVLTCLWCDAQIAMRVFRCLNEAYCGPSVASGWLYLAMLGSVYLVFEAASYLMRKARRASRG